MRLPALLALEDGSLFHGETIGADGRSVGEVVFNTAMTGYQEIITDPSYCRQIVTLTCPHVGIVGTTAEDDESATAHAAGLVVRDVPLTSSNWRSQRSIEQFLREAGLVAIAGVDTRRLTRLLREKGAQGGCLVAGADIDADGAIAAARDFPGMAGLDLARVVTTDESYVWREGVWRLDGGARTPGDSRFRVVAYDFGVKRNILRMLVERGCEVTVVPATTPAAEVLAMNPDGVFLSNGPGDPEPCDYAIAAIAELLETRLPLFGICLGHQLLGLAAGGRTLKMKFGHHGANHPVKDLAGGGVMVSSQNHGFAVDADSLPDNVRNTHVSLFDGSLQGIEFTDRPAFGFQGHPEASPGPHELDVLFDRFVRSMQEHRKPAYGAA